MQIRLQKILGTTGDGKNYFSIALSEIPNPAVLAGEGALLPKKH
jgi:hypothetical protein